MRGVGYHVYAMLIIVIEMLINGNAMWTILLQFLGCQFFLIASAISMQSFKSNAMSTVKFNAMSLFNLNAMPLFNVNGHNVNKPAIIFKPNDCNEKETSCCNVIQLNTNRKMITP